MNNEHKKSILNVLEDIYVTLVEITEYYQRKSTVPLEERKRWTKQEVLDKLKISNSTYKRNLQSGLLNPMRFSGVDEYWDEDILRAMEESRRKGRV